MHEVSKVNSAGTSATPSQADNTLFERLERVESEINALKADQSTKAKQWRKESLKSLEAY
jgi:protein-tyrosine-phosphatase